MRTVEIDCAGVQSQAEVWQRYLDAAQPEGASNFGRNLDAFWDAIEGGGPGWPGNVKVVFTNTADLALIRFAGGRSFLNALGEIARKATATTVELR